MVWSSGLHKNRLVLLVHCFLDLGMCGVQARLLLRDEIKVVEGHMDLGCRTRGVGREQLGVLGALLS